MWWQWIEATNAQMMLNYNHALPCFVITIEKKEQPGSNGTTSLFLHINVIKREQSALHKKQKKFIS